MMRPAFDYFQFRHQDSGRAKPEPEPLPDEAVCRVLRLLRQNGVPCFLPSDLLDSDIEKLIRGRG